MAITLWNVLISSLNILFLLSSTVSSLPIFNARLAQKYFLALFPGSVIKYVKLSARNVVYSIFIFHQILTSLSLVSFMLRGHELICIAGRVKITSELKRKIIAIELNLDLGCQHLYKGQQSLRLDAVINELAPLSLINSRRCSFKFLCEKMPMPLRSLTGRATY